MRYLSCAYQDGFVRLVQIDGMDRAARSQRLREWGCEGGPETPVGDRYERQFCEWWPRREEIEALADGSASALRRSGPDNAESHVSVGGDQSVIDTPFGDNACDLGQIDN